LTLQSFLSLVLVVATAIGLGLSFWLLTRPREDLGLPKLRWPIVFSGIVAAWAAPVVMVLSLYIGYRLALPTILEELATGGRAAAQSNTGEFGRAAVESHVMTTVVWGVILSPVVEELMFRGALWSAIQRATSALRRREPRSLPSELIKESALARLLKGSGRWFLHGGIATALTAALFAWMHHDQPGGAGMVRVTQTACLGVALGIARHECRSVVPGIVMHAAFNLLSLAKLRKWIVSPVGPKVDVEFRGNPISVSLPIPDWYWQLATVGTVLLALWLAHKLIRRHAKARATMSIARSRADVFAYLTRPDTIPEVFHGHGLIPGATQAELVSTGGMRKGAVRQVTNSDGSVIEEEITELEAPSKQSYMLRRGMRFPFSALVRRAGGDWTVREEGDGAHIEWTFTFELTTPLLWPIVAPLRRDFQIAMRKALLRKREILEQSNDNH